MLRVETIKKRQRKRKIYYAIFLVAAIGVFVFGVQQYKLLKSFDVSPVMASLSLKKAPKAAVVVSHDATADIQKIIDAYPDVTIGASYIDLTSGQKLNFGSDQPFVGASTTKLITAIDFLHKVESGQESLNETMGDYTAGWQLQQMIQESNNDSWSYIDSELGADQLTQYAASIGVDFQYNGNYISAPSMALLLQKLYNGELLNKSDTNLLLSYMQNTNNEELIPAALPSGATVHHKYGEIDNGVHDVAIVQENGKSFILVIYTNDNDGVNYNLQKDIIHQITITIINDIN